MRAELEADLDAFLFEDDGWEPGDEELPPPEDEIGANRLLVRLRHFEHEVARVQKLAAERIRPIEEFRDDRTRGARNQIERIARSLEVWSRSRYAATKGTVKTTKFPEGDLMLRARGRSLYVTDQTAAVRWARLRRRSWIRPKFEIDKTIAREEIVVGPKKVDGPQPADEGYEWREAFDADGDAIPGLLILEPVDPNFSYKTK